ncbi:MDR family NADP-dependent oxidoreductase [Streptomyces rubradiris]|uniref:NADP-dependent oxidoreductase n=1 Tax=Streptomyces rubradiris TaxID=285531 RepID=A0ABQ3R9U6_STRRR|nr:NADP-dependent oxidoreductase [Streptomyces rubradiris]GHH00496.1 NADP-dependent oxidoreductase [Streptomyces rubradiris]GHI52602.1 NADP-dependent oxidoreductase [Streptomyces rubradiris]
MTSVPQRISREVRLAALPAGLPTPTDFALAEVPVQAPAPGQVLVRNRQFLVYGGLRTLLSAAAKDTPMPTLRPGDTLSGPAVGEVVLAPPGSPLRPGDVVTHLRGWREYALVPEAECARADPALPDPVAQLASGSTAYGALTRVARVREGDVVLVTGAAGGVGSLAGQIARLLGASRVIGSTGSPGKAGRLVAELGYDAVLTAGSWREGRGSGISREAYRAFAGQLAGAAPDGIDVLLDTVGGPQLTAAVDAARQGARFVLVGALSGQLAAEGSGATAPTEIDTFRLIVKGVSMRGYLAADHPGVRAEWTARFADWLRSGQIRLPFTRVTGIDRAPWALQELIEGKRFGTVVVELPDHG